MNSIVIAAAPMETQTGTAIKHNNANNRMGI
jgi:hypothetical protein